MKTIMKWFRNLVYFITIPIRYSGILKRAPKIPFDEIFPARLHHSGGIEKRRDADLVSDRLG